VHWGHCSVQVKLVISKDLKVHQIGKSQLHLEELIFFFLILCSHTFLVKKRVKFMSKYSNDIVACRLKA
jgi:hypothetical protein